MTDGASTSAKTVREIDRCITWRLYAPSPPRLLTCGFSGGSVREIPAEAAAFPAVKPRKDQENPRNRPILTLALSMHSLPSRRA